MTITVRDICDFMNAWAPPAWAYSWDKAGLHTGSPDQPVERIMVCLTVTPEAVSAAIRARASMIIAHHPLIWEPLKTLRADDPYARMCLDLCNAGIACFSAHTNLDVAPDGVNAALAEKLNLLQPQVLFKEEHLRQVKLVTFVPETHWRIVLDALAAAGAGVIGNYTHCSFRTQGIGSFLPREAANPFSGTKGNVNEEPEARLEVILDKAKMSTAIKALYVAHPYEEPAYDLIPLENTSASVGLGMRGFLDKKMCLREFAEYVRYKLNIPLVKIVGNDHDHVHHVAVLGGNGASYLSRIPRDIDVYVTGDIGYHDAESAKLLGVNCIDAGHFGTETPVLGVITRRLRRHFKNVKCLEYKDKEIFNMIGAEKATIRGKQNAK